MTTNITPPRIIAMEELMPGYSIDVLLMSTENEVMWLDIMRSGDAMNLMSGHLWVRDLHPQTTYTYWKWVRDKVQSCLLNVPATVSNEMRQRAKDFFEYVNGVLTYWENLEVPKGINKDIMFHVFIKEHTDVLRTQTYVLPDSTVFICHDIAMEFKELHSELLLPRLKTYLTQCGAPLAELCMI